MGETIAQNRRARHDYSIEDTFEAGIVLRGTEIKSVRAHKVSLADAYARIERDEAGSLYVMELTRIEGLGLAQDSGAAASGP